MHLTNGGDGGTHVLVELKACATSNAKRAGEEDAAMPPMPPMVDVITALTTAKRFLASREVCAILVNGKKDISKQIYSKDTSNI